MEITLTFPNDIGTQIQNLPNTSAFVNKVVKEALLKKQSEPSQDTEMEGFKVMEWIRQVREEHYQLLKGKSIEEKLAFYHEGVGGLKNKLNKWA